MLSIYTIYKSPLDYPGMYVVRRFEYQNPTGDVYANSSVDIVRQWMHEHHEQLCRQKGYYVELARFARHPSDDQCIVESWV